MIISPALSGLVRTHKGRTSKYLILDLLTALVIARPIGDDVGHRHRLHRSIAPTELARKVLRIRILDASLCFRTREDIMLIFSLIIFPCSHFAFLNGGGNCVSHEVLLMGFVILEGERLQRVL